MVKVYSNRACVLHGHAQKAGSKTDKPKGSVIKCYYFGKDGDRELCIEKANQMHYAIMQSEK